MQKEKSETKLSEDLLSMQVLACDKHYLVGYEWYTEMMEYMKQARIKAEQLEELVRVHVPKPINSAFKPGIN